MQAKSEGAERVSTGYSRQNAEEKSGDGDRILKNEQQMPKSGGEAGKET
jgi:hypothetical protein